MDPSHQTDQRTLLVLRCQRGEREAWTQLVGEWEKPLFYYLRRLSPSNDEALNLLQDVWVRVFSDLASLRQPERLAPWLYVVARRTWARRFATSAREAISTKSDSISAENLELADPAHDDGEAGDDAEALHEALGRLALRDRDVLTLFYLNDLTLIEVAEVIEVPAGTVKSRLNHARARLRVQLERRKVNDD